MQHHLSSDTERVIETFLQAGTWRQSQQIVIQHSELLSLEVDRYLHSLVVDQDNERGQHFIEEHRALLARCREVGVEQAFEEKIQVSLAARPEIAGLVLMPSDLSPDLIVQLFTKMATHDKEGQLALLRQYPQLISLSTNNEEFTRVLEQYPDFREILGMPVISRSSQEHAIDFPPIFSNEMVSVNYLGGKIGQDVSALVPLIQIYERILHHKSIKKYPDFYIGILHNAAATYIQLPTGKREENLVRAIAYLEQALQIREIEKNKDIYAIVLFNLGNSYADLQRGDRGDNLLRAISYYYKTLDVWTRGTAPLQYASVQNNLGEALRLLLIDDHEQNLIRAVECYQNALTCRTPMSSPLGYAGTQLNLGIAYGQMKSGNRTEQLMKAIQCFQESLRFFTIALPLKYARAQHNMGTAYYELAILFSEESEAYLKRAETCFWEALCYRRLDVAPFEHASTQNNLGLVYRQLTARAPEYRQKAIDCFEATLHIYSLDDMPVNYRDTAHNLADMYYELKDWQQAFKYYQKALQGADRLYQSAFLPASRQAEIVTNASLYARIIVSCIQMKDNPLYARNALLYAERGKARTFLDQMGQKDIPTPVDIPRQFLERERTLIAQLRQVEQALAPMEQTDAMALQLAHQRKSLLD